MGGGGETRKPKIDIAWQQHTEGRLGRAKRTLRVTAETGTGRGGDQSGLEGWGGGARADSRGGAKEAARASPICTHPFASLPHAAPGRSARRWACRGHVTSQGAEHLEGSASARARSAVAVWDAGCAEACSVLLSRCDRRSLPRSRDGLGARPCVCERDPRQRRPLAVFFSAFYPKKRAVRTLAFLSPTGRGVGVPEWFVFLFLLNFWAPYFFYFQF